MAIFRPGSTIAAISGNLGGMCFVHSKTSPVVRTRMTKVHKHSEMQLAWRARHATVVGAWRFLTDQQRLAWNAAAQFLFRPNRLGKTRPISGFQLYTEYNLADLGETSIHTTPPENLIRSPLSEYVTLSASESGAIKIDAKLRLYQGLTHLYVSAARSVSDNPVFHVHFWKHIQRSARPHGIVQIIITTNFHKFLGPPFKGEVIAIKLGLKRDHYMNSFYVQASTVTLA